MLGKHPHGILMISKLSLALMFIVTYVVGTCLWVLLMILLCQQE